VRTCVTLTLHFVVALVGKFVRTRESAPSCPNGLMTNWVGGFVLTTHLNGGIVNSLPIHGRNISVNGPSGGTSQEGYMITRLISNNLNMSTERDGPIRVKGHQWWGFIPLYEFSIENSWRVIHPVF
jgi:hypothetical protein